LDFPVKESQGSRDCAGRKRKFGFIKRVATVKDFESFPNLSPLSTRLLKAYFDVSLSHRRSTTVSLETRNLFKEEIGPEI